MESLRVCPHGGLNHAELSALGLTPDEVLDFSVCSNPFPLPIELGKICDTIAINRYPDSEATELRQCLSEKLGVALDSILAGSGAVELLRLIALTYFGHKDSVLILEPTFGEYEVACQTVGAGVLKQRGRAEDSFALNIEDTVRIIRQSHPGGVFICNPNNPTGQYFSRQQIEAVLDACKDSLLILDEAYIAFAEGGWSSLGSISRGNVVIVRSMTKDYALAGLRLGYVIAHKGIIGSLRRVLSPWSVSVVAQKVGVAALKEAGYVDQCKKKITEAKKFLIDELSRIGFPPLPSKANFFLVRVGSGEAFRSALLRHGILVRDCASFGLPEYIRIAPRTMPECRKLIATIHWLMQKGELNVRI